MKYFMQNKISVIEKSISFITKFILLIGNNKYVNMINNIKIIIDMIFIGNESNS